MAVVCLADDRLTVPNSDDEQRTTSEDDQRFGPEPIERMLEEVPQQRIQKWITDLSSPVYRVRELASLRLLSAGEVAIPALEDGLVNGDLETTSRIIGVLRKLSASFNPLSKSKDLAWESLTKISVSGTSTASARARHALQEIRDERKEIAVEVLSSSGVFIGIGEYHLGSTVLNDFHLQVPKNWIGNTDKLYWLSWMSGVQTVILAGDRIDAKVASYAAQMPDVRNLVIRDTNVDAEHINALKNMIHLEHFQLVNVAAGDELIDSIVELPILRSMTLFGTDITFKGRERLIEQMPAVDVECRGGFLGVHCSPLNHNCEVRSVTPQSAAEEAGVKAQDVIIKFGEYDVHEFADLQDAIGRHMATKTKIPMMVNRMILQEVDEGEGDEGEGDELRRRHKSVKQTITLQVTLKRIFP